MRWTLRFAFLVPAFVGCKGEPANQGQAPAVAPRAEQEAPAPEPVTPEPTPSPFVLGSLAEKGAFGGEAELRRRFKNGLVTEDFRVGQGRAARIGSRLKLRYVGFLADGQVFDDAREETGPPARLELLERPRVKGWGQGLQGIKAGTLRKIVVPAALAYGDRGDPASEPDEVSIPPGATLTYFVQVLEVRAPIPAPVPPSAYEGPVLARKRHKNGLVVEDQRLGQGEAAAMGDQLELHYTGYLKDGSAFDTTTDGRAPFRVALGDKRMIDAWNQGLVGMKAGGLRTLRVPAKLGYGKRAPGKIPPHAPLVFRVQLIGLSKAALPKGKNGHP